MKYKYLITVEIFSLETFFLSCLKFCNFYFLLFCLTPLLDILLRHEIWKYSCLKLQPWRHTETFCFRINFHSFNRVMRWLQRTGPTILANVALILFWVQEIKVSLITSWFPTECLVQHALTVSRVWTVVLSQLWDVFASSSRQWVMRDVS